MDLPEDTLIDKTVGRRRMSEAAFRRMESSVPSSTYENIHRDRPTTTGAVAFVEDNYHHD